MYLCINDVEEFLTKSTFVLAHDKFDKLFIIIFEPLHAWLSAILIQYK